MRVWPGFKRFLVKDFVKIICYVVLFQFIKKTQMAHIVEDFKYIKKYCSFFIVTIKRILGATSCLKTQLIR